MPTLRGDSLALHDIRDELRTIRRILERLEARTSKVVPKQQSPGPQPGRATKILGVDPPQQRR